MLQMFTSTTRDGSMKSTDMNYRSVLATRQTFLAQHGIKTTDTTLVQLVYEGTDYCRYRAVSDADKGDGITRDATIVADALVTTTQDHALFLPLADCIGAVIHDPVQDILMLSHLGRHNLEQYGGTKSIQYLVEHYACDPKNLTVWLSPAAGNEKYPLYAFDNRSMHDVANEQFCDVGVLEDRIELSSIDTTKDSHYFSHSEFLRGRQATDGRFAVVAMLL